MVPDIYWRVPFGCAFFLGHDRVASATAASVKIRAAIWLAPSGSCSARAEATTTPGD